uniref:DUF6824 domain-containing protein n=1 Tax=Amphora coffeiformis TaxID=265554 RepID=A0A7S3L3H3_9STRA|mmetsp:Transcript_19301/g.39125  ORF Transcript_19301/g.39125 Transcript_19301/m.39125 type:complete len:221 (+) Transcript_19301:544-1206(+)
MVVHYFLVGIEVMPSPDDVILGKGETSRYESNMHQGNIRFRKILEQSVLQFSICRERSEKIKVIKSVHDSILNRGGRFLQRDRSGLCVVASPERVKRAIYQAFHWLKKKDTGKNKDVGSVPETKLQTEAGPTIELFTDEELRSVLPFQLMRSKVAVTNKKTTCKKHVGSVSVTKSQTGPRDEDLFTDEELFSVLPGAEPVDKGRIMSVSCPRTMQSSLWI